MPRNLTLRPTAVRPHATLRIPGVVGTYLNSVRAPINSVHNSLCAHRDTVRADRRTVRADVRPLFGLGGR